MDEVKDSENTASYGQSHSRPTQKMSERKDSYSEDEQKESTPLKQSPVDDETPEAETASENDGQEKDGVPYDTGWAWVVLIGCFLNYVILAGYLKCLSLFYVEILNRYDATATEAALIFSIRAALFSVSSPFVMSGMVGRLGIRKTVLAGALMLSLSGILSSQVDQMMAVTVLVGGLLGFGQAMLMSPADVLLGHYFQKRRQLALGLAKCGSSLGNMAAPPLISFFLRSFGLSGTLLLTGGLCLHCFPSAMLFRPIRYFTRQPVQHQRATDSSHSQEPRKSVEETKILITRHSRDDVSAEKNMTSQAGDSRPEVFADRERKTATAAAAELTTTVQDAGGESCQEAEESSMPLIQRINCKKVLPEDSLPSKRACARQRQKMTPDEFQQQSEDANTGNIREKFSANSEEGIGDASLVLIYHPSSTQKGSSDERDEEEEEKVSSKRSVQSSAEGQSLKVGQESGASDQKGRKGCAGKKRSNCGNVVSSMLDFSLFSLPLFRVLLAYFTLFSCHNMMVNYLPALAVENGYTQSEAAQLLAIIGGLDLLCRFSCALLANFKVLKVSTMLAISFAVLGVTAQFVRFMTSWAMLVTLSVLLGLLSGVPNTTLAMLVLDFVGLDKMGKALGFCIFILGASTAAIYPLLGYIRDLTGSYFVVYHVLGGAAVLEVCILSSERWVRSLQEKKLNVSRANTSTP